MNCKYKYEPVTDMTVGQVIDAAMIGERFYYLNGKEIIFSECTLPSLARTLKNKRVTRCIETKWTDNLPQECVVWDDDCEKYFQVATITKITDSNRFLDDECSNWKNAHPITDDTTVGQMKEIIKGV